MSFRDLKLILVPTDFGLTSERALEVAIDLGRLTRASLEILHVNSEAIWVVPPPGDVMVSPVDVGEALAESAARLEAVVARVRAAGLSCSGSSEVGRTDAEIVEYARKRQAGMIVVGSHARHGLSHAIMGSVAEKVVRHAPCPVLVVPPMEEPVPVVRPDDEDSAIELGLPVGQPA
ncbi:MAG TPA: universal stress protein [Polyangia bacterium]